MESLNFAKGYGKIGPTEHPPTNHRKRKIIAASLTIFLTLSLGSLIAALIHHTSTESEDSEPSSLTSNSLKTICSVTRYPDSCFSSMINSQPSSSNTPLSPLHFFNLSLHACKNELSHIKTLLNPSNFFEPAMKDCTELFDDSLSQLEKSSAELNVHVGPGDKVLTKMKISDIKTWVSAAMTDQETCLDGLEETGSTAVVEFKMRVHKSQEYMSNTLAILSNIQSLYEKFGLKMP